MPASKSATRDRIFYSDMIQFSPVKPQFQRLDLITIHTICTMQAATHLLALRVGNAVKICGCRATVTGDIVRFSHLSTSRCLRTRKARTRCSRKPGYTARCDVFRPARYRYGNPNHGKPPVFAGGFFGNFNAVVATTQSKKLMATRSPQHREF